MQRRRFLGAMVATAAAPIAYKVSSAPAKINTPARHRGTPLVKLGRQYDIATDDDFGLATLLYRGRQYWISTELPEDPDQDADVERSMVLALAKKAGLASRGVAVTGSIRSSMGPHL